MKTLFNKEIKIWVLYLTIVLGLIFSFAFGVLVRQELVGYVKMGPVSKAALFIADIPSSMRKSVKKLTYKTIPLDEQIWSTSAGTNLAERFFNGDQINKKNVNKLAVLWEYNSGYISPNDTVQTTPIFTGDHLITVSVQGHLISLNPKNGKENWKVKFDKPVGRRGLTYIEDRGNGLGGIYVASGQFVLHIDQKDGSTIKTFDSGVSLLQPFVFDDSLLVATMTAGVKSFDVRTGSKKWETRLTKNGVTPRIWSGFSFDGLTRTIVVVTSNPGDVVTKNIDGDEPPDDLDYSVSVIAIDIDDGSIKWQYKHIYNDKWDYDLVGNPMIIRNLKTRSQKGEIDCVVALSKTGDVIMLDLATGQPVFKDSFTYIAVPSSDIPGVKTTITQKKYLKPEPFSGIKVELETDFNHLNHENLNFVNAKLRHAKAGLFIPPSVNYDVVFYGVHGGAEWPGGSISRNKTSTDLIVPSNRNPWIIRVFYKDKMPNDAFYQEYSAKCSDCHGSARQGHHQTELQGDEFFPPLVGLFKSEKWLSVDTVGELKSLHQKFNINVDIEAATYKNMMEYFSDYDLNSFKKNNLFEVGFWQLLLDKDHLPATKPPWGKITSINLNNGTKNWEIPFGDRIVDSLKTKVLGDINFGGVMTMKSGLIFATGTPNEMAYAFDVVNGKKLWESKLPSAGSAPPMGFTYRGCDLVVFTATGGKFFGYRKKGDSTIAYKLRNCIFDQ